MASAFVSIAQAAATAPLNPAYREDEFDFYLDDLKAKALVLASGEDGPARTVAARRGVPVIETPHFCGTGTRYLQDPAKKAIDQLFERSFGAR